VYSIVPVFVSQHYAASWTMLFAADKSACVRAGHQTIPTVSGATSTVAASAAIAGIYLYLGYFRNSPQLNVERIGVNSKASERLFFNGFFFNGVRYNEVLLYLAG
jgi:hypothetical protein